MLRLVDIEATTLPDAWFQTIYKCLEIGRDFRIDQGSYEGEKRLEFDYITLHIKHPGSLPLLPSIPSHYNIPDPVAPDYLDSYLPYLMTDKLQPGESYTYGQRLTGYPIPTELAKEICHNWKNTNHNILRLEDAKAAGAISVDYPSLYFDLNDQIRDMASKNIYKLKLDQLKLASWTYRNKGHRNNQIVLQVAHPSDMLLKDPPCLRYIDTRIQDGKLHFVVYFRSWDLFNGLPANLAAIQLLKEFMAAEIGVEDGEIIASSKGLHIYQYVWELAECIRGKTIEQFRSEMTTKGDDNG